MSRAAAVAVLPTIWRTRWDRRAECSIRGLDRALFFPEVGQPIDPRVLSACSACRVRQQCLRSAMRMERAAELGGQILRYGIWGGLTPRQRTNLAQGKTVRFLVTTATRNKGKRRPSLPTRV